MASYLWATWGVMIFLLILVKYALFSAAVLTSHSSHPTLRSCGLRVFQAFAGHLGRNELSAAVLATSILNVTGFAALAGLASAMETLCGQVSSASIPAPDLVLELLSPMFAAL